MFQEGFTFSDLINTIVDIANLAEAPVVLFFNVLVGALDDARSDTAENLWGSYLGKDFVSVWALERILRLVVTVSRTAPSSVQFKRPTQSIFIAPHLPSQHAMRNNVS